MKAVNVGGGEIHFEDRGEGPPLLLVHGFPLDHSMWTGKGDSPHLCAAPEGPFRQMGTVPFSIGFGETSQHCSPSSPPSHKSHSSVPCRLLAPDLRGFGRSPPQTGKGDSPHLCAAPEGPFRQMGTVPFSCTMEAFADDLAGLLDALEIAEPVVFCGLSMGGYIALQFWRKHRSRLRGLVLCDTRASADSPEAAAARGILADRVLREGTAPLVESMLPKLVAKTTRREKPHVLDDLRRMIAAADPRGVAAALRGMAERPDMSAALGEIECPTLVVVGREDVVTPPAEMRAMADAIPRARFVEIPEAGHVAPLENPAATAAALAEFVRDI